MAYPLDNLGDYNKVRNDLKIFDGCAEKLYRHIGDNAVKQAAPKIFLFGGAAVLAVGAVAQYGIKLWKDHKSAIIEEPTVHAAFQDVVNSCTIHPTEDPKLEEHTVSTEDN